MSFLQPWMLWVLPAIALPVLIHLIYQHRHRSVEWAAMMFLVKAGVYRNGDAWAAINRSLVEDDIKVTDLATVDGLFEGFSYQRIDDSVGDTASLASEVWRLFLLVMAIALITEAFLSMPEKQTVQRHSSSFLPTGNQRQEAA